MLELHSPPGVITMTGQQTRITWLNMGRTTVGDGIAVVSVAVAVVVVTTVSTMIVGTFLIVAALILTVAATIWLLICLVDIGVFKVLVPHVTLNVHK
mmetsp:Transcript_18562/g.28658  ORF Transcript_18562/g.28658 Transcript_18562/m.28658 type:complete len:97 (+) Transcript_18562:83-373(+)